MNKIHWIWHKSLGIFNQIIAPTTHSAPKGNTSFQFHLSQSVDFNYFARYQTNVENITLFAPQQPPPPPYRPALRTILFFLAEKWPGKWKNFAKFPGNVALLRIINGLHLTSIGCVLPVAAIYKIEWIAKRRQIMCNAFWFTKVLLCFQLARMDELLIGGLTWASKLPSVANMHHLFTFRTCRLQELRFTILYIQIFG